MRNDAKEFARDLVAAWNSHDLDRILAHYSEDFELTSPVLKRVRGLEDGTLRGKNAVREWWRHALDKVPELRIELVGMSSGVDSAAMTQRITGVDGLGVSFFRFAQDGRIEREIFHCG